MSQEVVAKRYAVALFQLAGEQNTLDQIEEELKVVNSVIAENEKFITLITHPKFSIEKKKELVKEVLSGVSNTVMNTMLLLVDRKRENLISEVVSYYVELANEARGIADATVYSTRELTEDEEKALSETFSKRIGKEKLRIHNVIDKSLVAGVKIRIGNTIYDGSVKRKLERIERQLVSAK